MADANKIDSNATGLAIAEEAEIGYLPGENGNAGSPVWIALEPNTYPDFGSEIVTVAPNPINSSRQRRKGVTTDLKASGGFNQNFSFFGIKDLMQGVFFASIRDKGTEHATAVVTSGSPDVYNVASTTGFLVGSLIKGFGFTNSANNAVNKVTAVSTNTSVSVIDGALIAEASPPTSAIIKVIGYIASTGDIDVTVTGDFATYTSTSLDFTTLGLIPGQWIYVGGDGAGTFFANDENNGYKRIRSIAAYALVVDKSAQAMTAETSTTETIRIFFGDVLKNELADSMVRRTYQLERTLGAPDLAAPSAVQSEVLVGSVLNEVTLNVPTANLMTADFAFMALDGVQRTSAQGPKQSSVQRVMASDVVNTSSDVQRIRMAILSDNAEYVTPLFGFVTEAKFMINNNVKPDKAVGVLGSFDMSTGTFQVGGTVTAYFSRVEAVQAVRNNADVTIDMIIAKDNQGVVLDLPLISLGDGRLKVEKDNSITLPLNMDAATAVDINANLDYTAMLTYFWYLPSAAM
jgi:hypothetical protein